MSRDNDTIPEPVGDDVPARRRSSRRSSRLRSTWHALMAIAMLPALLTACGEQGSESPPPSFSPSSSSGAPPGMSPSSPPAAAASPGLTASPRVAPPPAAVYGRCEAVPKGAITAIRSFFEAVSAGDAHAAKALLTPDSRDRDDPLMGFRAVTRVRVDAKLHFPPPKGYSAEPEVSARVDAVQPSGWGPVGTKHFFVTLRESPSGTWLIDHLSSGR